jgi:hypothetical protein
VNMAAPPGATYVNEGAGQQINADSVRDVYYIHRHVRESVEAYALTEDEITRLRAIYVRTPAADRILGIFQMRNAVALIGPRGRGRRITSVAVIDELRATPHRIDLDPDDARRDLPADPDCGYLVDVDEQTVQEISALSDLLNRYVQQLASVGSRLLITATPGAWNALELRATVTSVNVGPSADPVAIFRSHLDHLCHGEGDRWAVEPEVLKILDGASPADAVRLAGLANAVLTSGSVPDPVREAVSAYQNWSEELAKWFKENEGGYVRALLIAAAALDETDAASVFDAADHLSQKAGLPRAPGGGLVGHGIKGLLDEIDAEPTADGRVRLPRPDYASSVLDHIWTDRPQLRASLRQWFADLPGILRGPAAARACDSLIGLAIRQDDAVLITDAVSTWATQAPELAAAALTEAGVAGGIGRMVRRTMYRWATRSTTDRSIQVTVAAVCGGPFGVSFPRNAMTRLRHLALHGEAEVQQRVIEAVQSLAGQPRLCDFILREVLRWMTEPGQPRVPGVRAFLALSSEMAADVLPRTPSDFSRIDLLAAGLRASLHDPEHTEPTREVCSQWLESAAQGKVPGAVVTNVITGTCHDSYDIGLLIPVVWRWAQSDGQPAPVPRQEIGAELIQKLTDRDPLAPSVSAETVYRTASEGGR